MAVVEIMPNAPLKVEYPFHKNTAEWKYIIID